MNDERKIVTITVKAEKKNIRYIDIVKALAIILVILGHINFANQNVKAWIYAFHMPAFFFASGLLLKNHTGNGIRQEIAFCWQKFQSLMFPYFLWAILYTTINGHNLIRILYGSHQTLGSADTLTSLWFLPVLFLAMVLFAVSRLVFGKRFRLPVKLVLAAVFLAAGNLLPKYIHGYPWGANLTLQAFGFLMLGNALFPTLQRVREKMNGRSGLGIAVLVLCLSFAATLLYRWNVPAGGYINVANAEFGSYPLFVLLACVGIAFLLALSMVLDRLLPERQTGLAGFLVFFGKNTMCVFATHKLFIRVFKRLFAAVQVPEAVALIVSCLGTMAACCLVALFLNRYLPTLAGRVPDRIPEKGNKE